MTTPATLYHYCSTSTFQSILESKSLRLSLLTLSNDEMEGKLVSKVIEKIATRHSLEYKSLIKLLEMMGRLERQIHGFGFCLSEESDSLAQWRGYAHDGTGVAIGISTQYLEWVFKSKLNSVPFRLTQIEYDNTNHESEIEPAYQKIIALIEQGAFENISNQMDLKTHISIILLSLFPKLFSFKSSAFFQEREWRILSHDFRGIESPWSYRTAEDRLIPFQTLSLPYPFSSAISEVILGPKHSTPEIVVEKFLYDEGFSQAKVLRSKITYR